jgi:hypothetical protein
MSKPKIQSFQLIKDLLEKSADTEPKSTVPKFSSEDVHILKEATGVDFMDTFDKLGLLKN